MATNKKKLWRGALLVYVALLAASHVVRRIGPGSGSLAAHQAIATVSVVNAPGGVLPGEVRIAYADWKPETGALGEVVVLLHGTPMAGESFDALAPHLAVGRRVLVPDLPGFGGSTRRIPDYSIRAHARYLLALLDHLGITRAHLAGYSQGGGVALECYALEPERVCSLIMLSSIGVQELELLGDYRLNHGIHFAQLAGLALIQEGTPHFGWLDNALLNVAYARNFYDSDQRSLRPILKTFEPPMQILHGRDDGLVPLAAATEHARIVPQSELVVLEGGHGLLFSEGGLLAERMEPFFARAEEGLAAVRADASAERLAAAAEPFDASASRRFEGLGLLVVCLLLALATYITEDLTCITAGFMAARGALDFWQAVMACLIGIYTGDTLHFLAGRHLGRPALRRAPLRWFVSEARLAQSRAWFARKGPAVIVLSRFVPGTRVATCVAAGMLHTSFWKFSLYFLLAAVVWTPLLVGLAYVFGAKVLAWLETYQAHGVAALALAVLFCWLLLKVAIPSLTFRGRRLLVGAWRRKIRWEFWPPWAFYPPIVAYVLFLGLRHRCLTLFTAANPAMPQGGFIGESKSRILEGLTGDGVSLARHRLIPARATPLEGLQAVREFMKGERLSFPIVLKPDAGQRGQGVVVARSEAEVEACFNGATPAMMVQEHVPGREYGIFYYRLPEETQGRIFTITDKRFPVVTGDGRSTVEELILNDERAVCMARHYMNGQAERLYTVPAAGESVQLVELGTHCLGAVFLDGSRLHTPALEEAMDRLSRTYAGFYFGRYDVRVPSEEDLRAGRRIKVIELNGVTSEATSIYDPGNSLLTAYRILARQWRLAFEIGAKNRAAGARPDTVFALIRAWRRYRSGLG